MPVICVSIMEQISIKIETYWNVNSFASSAKTTVTN